MCLYSGELTEPWGCVWQRSDQSHTSTVTHTHTHTHAHIHMQSIHTKTHLYTPPSTHAHTRTHTHTHTNERHKTRSVLRLGLDFPPGGARTLSRGGAMSQTEKKKTIADLSLVSESSLSGEMQGAGLTQTNQIRFCSSSTNQNGVLSFERELLPSIK